MKRVTTLIVSAAAIEVVFLALCLLFPGAGHSPLWYTQLPALILVNHFDASIGSCIPCAPGYWVLGATFQAILIAAALLAFEWVMRSLPGQGSTD